MVRNSFRQSQIVQSKVSKRSRPSAKSKKKFFHQLTLELLEDRRVPSTILWTNEGNSNNDSDNFNAVFGNNAATARLDVEAVFHAWENVITSFNYSDSSLNDTYKINLSMSSNTGFSAGESDAAQSGGKPTQANISVNTGNDAHGSGWFLDPTPNTDEEFLGTLINPYTGAPTPGGPADGKNDFYSFVMAETAHAMGLTTNSSDLFNQDPNHYLTNSGQNDTFDTPGKLWTYNGPDVQALFTSNNGGAGGSDRGAALHVAEPSAGNVVTSGGITYYSSFDTDAADGDGSVRLDISNLDAQVLKDSYGYTINPPTSRNMYIVFDPGTGVLHVRGGSSGAKIFPQQSNPSNDTITLDTFSFLGLDFVCASVSIGNPVPGSGPNPTYTTCELAGSVTSISVDGGDGNDTINILRSASGVPITITSSAGHDTVNIGHDGTVQDILSPVSISNPPSFTTINIDDSSDGGGHTVTITNSSVTGLAPASISYNENDIDGLNIDGSQGSSTYNVLSTPFNGLAFPETRLTCHGPATVNVGNGGSVQGVVGDLFVTDPPNFATLNIDDSADSGGRTVTITDSEIAGLAPGTIHYQQCDLNGLTIVGSNAASTYNILSTGSCFGFTTELVTGAGNDVVNVQATSDTLNLINFAGSDTVTIGSQAPSLGGTLSNIAGPVNVSNVSGPTHLIVDDSGDSAGRTATITDSSLTGLAPVTISYDAFTSLEVHGGSGGNTFTIQSTPAGVSLNSGIGNDQVNVQATSTPVSIDGDAGNDTVTIGSMAPSLGGTLTNIAGPVSVSNTSGSTQLIVDDSGDSTGRTATITNSSLTGLSPAAISYSSPGLFGPGVNSLEVDGGSGGNTFNILSTAAGTPVSIFSGTGNDAVNVQATSGSVAIDGENGQDVVTIGSLAPSLGGTLTNIAGPVSVSNTSGSTSLIVDDSGDSTGQTATITNSSVTGLSPAAISYSSPGLFGPGVNSLEVHSGSGGNTLNVVSTAAGTPTTVAAGTGSKVIVGTPTGGASHTLQNILGRLRIEQSLASSTPSVLVDDSGNPSAAARNVTFSFDTSLKDYPMMGLSPAPIAFQFSAGAPVTIQGDGGNESFQLNNNLDPGVQYAINGQGGTNKLDYSGYTGDVTVDLPLGMATALTGGISNIQNVTGSIGNDILVGDDNPNVLIGGTGRNLIIGGKGADQITAGGGDSILIGGYTDYDKNIAALDAIMAEWLSADNYDTRYGFIKDGGGLNGSFVLKKATVHDDFASDTLNGGPGRDWFISSSGDVLNGVVTSGPNKEHVTMI
jgi:acrosin